jgi:mercuric ion binding protein
MKKLFYGLVFSLAIVTAASAETVDVTINGMVCAFCAQGIDAKLKDVTGVGQIKVDLDNGLVQYHDASADVLPDPALTDLITQAGYTVVSIKRSAD